MEKKTLQLVMESSAVTNTGGVLDPQKSQLSAVTGL